jgi:hypothetical protein
MIHFVVHDEHDSVGVVVVEGVRAGDQLTGWIMDQDKTLDTKVLNDVPIGHKIAIRDLEKQRHRHQVRYRHRPHGRANQSWRASACSQRQDQALVSDGKKHFRDTNAKTAESACATT